MQRYAVTVTREVVVYALSPEEASAKALAYFKIMSSEQPASRPVVVTAVTELGAPESETNGVIVDKAPASESRAG
jgi:hypothetical protein